MEKELPDYVEQAHLEYLDALRESGTVNMFGAAAYVRDEFDLDMLTARKVLLYWMETFGERHG